MSLRSFAAALPAAIVFGATLTAAVAAPSMSSSWTLTKLSQQACLQRAEHSIRAHGFNTRFEIVGKQSVFGEHGDYTALVRCAAGKGFVFFVVAGPHVAEASRQERAIAGGF